MALDGTLHRIFQRNLRAIRKSKGLTQEEVADRMSVTQANYAQLETGQSAPTLNTVERVAVALGVGYEEILSSKKLETVAG